MRSIWKVWGQTIIETLIFHSWNLLSLSYSLSFLISPIPLLHMIVRNLRGGNFILRATKLAVIFIAQLEGTQLCYTAITAWFIHSEWTNIECSCLWAEESALNTSFHFLGVYCSRQLPEAISPNHILSAIPLWLFAQALNLFMKDDNDRSYQETDCYNCSSISASRDASIWNTAWL